MKQQNELKSKANALFSDSLVPKTFENHMPEKVGSFLLEVSKGNIDAKKLQEDINFARSISLAIQH